MKKVKGKIINIIIFLLHFVLHSLYTQHLFYFISSIKMPFPDDQIAKWLKNAYEDCSILQDHEDETNLFGSPYFNCNDGTSYWAHATQFCTWWKNNIERKSKFKLMIKESKYEGDEDKMLQRAIFTKNIVSLAHNIKSHFNRLRTNGGPVHQVPIPHELPLCINSNHTSFSVINSINSVNNVNSISSVRRGNRNRIGSRSSTRIRNNVSSNVCNFDLKVNTNMNLHTNQHSENEDSIHDEEVAESILVIDLNTGTSPTFHFDKNAICFVDTDMHSIHVSGSSNSILSQSTSSLDFMDLAIFESPERKESHSGNNNDNDSVNVIESYQQYDAKHHDDWDDIVDTFWDHENRIIQMDVNANTTTSTSTNARSLNHRAVIE